MAYNGRILGQLLGHLSNGTILPKICRVIWAELRGASPCDVLNSEACLINYLLSEFCKQTGVAFDEYVSYFIFRRLISDITVPHGWTFRVHFIFSDGCGIVITPPTWVTLGFRGSPSQF